jgi:hypothetical protein
VTGQLQDCAQLNELEWNQTEHSAANFVKSKSVDWHKELDGKKLRLTLLEVRLRFCKI